MEAVASFHNDYPTFKLDLDVTYIPEVDIVLGMDWMQSAKLAIDFGHGHIEFPMVPIEVRTRKVRRTRADKLRPRLKLSYPNNIPVINPRWVTIPETRDNPPTNRSPTYSPTSDTSNTLDTMDTDTTMAEPATLPSTPNNKLYARHVFKDKPRAFDEDKYMGENTWDPGYGTFAEMELDPIYNPDLTEFEKLKEEVPIP